MEENLKKTFKAINEYADYCVELKELLEKEQRKNIRLGMEIQKLKDSYSWKELVKFLKGKSKNDYHNLFGKLKPLYDEFGYITVNKLIIEIADEEEKVKEQKQKAKEQKSE